LWASRTCAAVSLRSLVIKGYYAACRIMPRRASSVRRFGISTVLFAVGARGMIMMDSLLPGTGARIGESKCQIMF